VAERNEGEAVATQSVPPESNLPFPSKEREAADADLQPRLVDLVDLTLTASRHTGTLRRCIFAPCTLSATRSWTYGAS
jgi:hypothetical protein